MTMDLDSIVRVTETLEPVAPAVAFGRALFVYAGDATGATRAAIAGARARDLRVNQYATLSEVADDYDSTHTVYKAAAKYFGQIPHPRREFMAAGWHAAGAVSYILGGDGFTGAGPLVEIKGVGDTTIGAAGASVNVSLAVSETGTAGYTAVAAAIQAALRTISTPDLSAVTVAYVETDGAFQVTVPVGIDIQGSLTGPGAAAVGLGAANAAYYSGVAAEAAIADGLDRIERADATWYWLLLDPALANSSTGLAAATWASTRRRKHLAIDATGVDTLTANEVASRAAGIAALRSQRTPIIWSNALDYKGSSLVGLFAGTNFNARDSLPTPFGKPLRGCAVDVLTSAQRTELERKRINYYSTVGGEGFFRPGVAPAAGWWIDFRFWLDWLIQKIQVDVFTLVRGERRIPLTARGIGRIQAVIEDACDAGRNNGGIAPGKVSETTAAEIRQATGAVDFNGTLSRGYLVHIESVDDQPLVNRQARMSPPVKVWFKWAGAVHSVDVELSFSS